MEGIRKVRHLVMWVADTDRPVENPLDVDAFLRSVTATMATREDILWATHDLDRESVCFSIMVEGPGLGADAGLAEARLRARSCLRACLGDAGLLESSRSNRRGAPPITLRLDATPLQLQPLRTSAPADEKLN